MKKTTKIPKMKHFYSSLSEKTISKDDHKFATTVWKKFKCKNLLDYTLTYCKIDTILLAEIFQSFRTKMHNFSGLDPAHYISLPAFGYDSMLKITSSQIELPQDINIVHFLENAKRGGNCFIGTRNLKETTNSEIVYIDCNNLYGGAQMCKLPIGEYQWLTDRELKDFDITKEDLDGNIGYFVECDLRYPSSLHKKHSNFPLAPEFLQVEEKDLSPYQIHALQITQKSNTYKDCKLMCTYFDRQNLCFAWKKFETVYRAWTKITENSSCAQISTRKFYCSLY